jgi:hypothetical protein
LKIKATISATTPVRSANRGVQQLKFFFLCMCVLLLRPEYSHTFFFCVGRSQSHHQTTCFDTSQINIYKSKTFSFFFVSLLINIFNDHLILVCVHFTPG